MTNPIQETDGIVLLGAEMLTWSDFGGATGPVRGRIAGQLLHTFGGVRRRALLVGPHAASVVLEVAEQFESVDVLVRSLEDARTLRAELPADVTLHCGPLDRFTPASPYSAVIALDGINRLHSAEERQPAWAVTLEQLTALLGDTGELFLGLGNEAGIDRLLALGPDQRHDDVNWPNAHVTVDEMPLGVDEVSAVLAAGSDLARIETWACYGERAEPLLAAPAATYSRLRRDPRLGALVDRAAHRAVGGLVPVKNAGITARTLVRHGLGAEVAPLWVLHFRVGVADREITPEDLILVAEPADTDGLPGLAARIRVGADEWHRTAVRGAADAAGAVDVRPGLERDLDLYDGVVPAGTPLDVRLSELCAAHDLTGVSQLVRRYHDWLTSDAESGVVAAAKVPVVFSGLVDTGTELAVFDGSLRATEPAHVDEVFVRAALVAAREVLASGLRHPWPASVGSRDVCEVLVAAADLELTDSTFEKAVLLDLRLSGAGDEAAATAVASPESYAEAIELLEGHRQRAEELQAQLDWLIINIHQRQRQNRFMMGRLEKLRESPEFRLGRKLLFVRTFYYRVRRAVRRRLGLVTDRPAAGEWRAPTGKERDPIEVEQDLLPPGYTTDQTHI